MKPLPQFPTLYQHCLLGSLGREAFFRIPVREQTLCQVSGTLRLHTDEVEEQVDGIAHARHSHMVSREEGVVGMERTGLEFRAAGLKSGWHL